MAYLTDSLWRKVGGFADIKAIGNLEAVAKQCNTGLNNDFWRNIWVTRCGGRVFKSRQRDYKLDVLVHFAKVVHRRMQTCTAVNRWYNDWHEAVRKRRRVFEIENRHLRASIEACVRHIDENKRKLVEISRVDEQAHAVIDTMEAYGKNGTGPMRTQRRRIEARLAASNVNPWQHYYNP